MTDQTIYPKFIETDPIYLDYNASTPIDKAVADAMVPYLYHHFGNPSSNHVYGNRTKAAINEARNQVAHLISADPSEILFLSGGSESINMSLIGGALHLRDQGKTIIASCFEHPAVNETLDYLHKEYNFNIIKLNVDIHGFLNVSELVSSLSPDVVLVTCMLANNELGSIQPIQEICSVVKNYAREHNIEILMHTDASQAMGKIDVNAHELGVDYLTLAAHKFYGPKGVGCSYIRNGSLKPLVLIHGASQEMGLRAGTENVILDVGIGKAAELVKSDIHEKIQQYYTLRNKLRELLIAGSPVYTRVNSVEDPSKCLPNTLSISFKGIPASCIIAHIKDKVATSAGAACHSAGDEFSLSPVLEAAHIPVMYALGTLRLSVGRYTTEDDIEKAAKYILEAISSLIQDPIPAMIRVWTKLNINKDMLLKNGRDTDEDEH
ncbi:hypothetical protein WA158_000298 [Blastocystis sp. Blastoise]